MHCACCASMVPLVMQFCLVLFLKLPCPAVRLLLQAVQAKQNQLSANQNFAQAMEQNQQLIDQLALMEEQIQELQVRFAAADKGADTGTQRSRYILL